MGELWIGTSGYVYPHWRRGVFYPDGLRQRDELAWYAGAGNLRPLARCRSRGVFLDRASLLGPKLGLMLCQLPPTLEADTGVLTRFIEGLPGDLRWVIEFRHPRWHTAEVS